MPERDPLLTKLNKLWDESRRVKEVIEKDWRGARDMLRGDQLPKRRPEHKPPAVLNMLRPLIERKLALLTDTKPRFSVQPRRTGEGFAKAAKLLDEACQAYWDDSCLDMVIKNIALYAEVYGTGISQTIWSPSKSEIVLAPVNPYCFYIDPYILSADQLADAEYVIFEEFPSLQSVRARFGDAAKAVKPWTPPSQMEGEGWTSRIARRLMSPFSRERDDSNAIPHTWLRHYWIKDYKTADIEVTKGDKKETIRKRLYPGGRYIVWANDGIVLHDKPNPYYDLVHPFDMMPWYEDVESPWGDSEIQAQKSPQQMLNKVTELMVESTMLACNPVWIADQNAFPADEGPLGWGQLTNVPGNVIKKRPGTEVRRDFPQGMPASVMQLLQHLEQFIESRAGGFNEAMTGKKPGQVQSGLGIEQLQMAGSALIRLKARTLENFIQRVGSKIISRMIQFYTTDRVFHILGPGSEFTQFTFIRKQFTDALSAESLADAHKDFTFRVAPGTSLSLTKIQKALVAQQLYMAGAVDRQYLLETLEVPDWPEVLRRTVQEQALGLEPGGQKGKSKRGHGPVDRQSKIAGRT